MCWITDIIQLDISKLLNGIVHSRENNMAAITAALKPILLAFLTSEAVRKLVVDLLTAYAGTTDNSIDDGIVAIVAQALKVETTEA